MTVLFAQILQQETDLNMIIQTLFSFAFIVYLFYAHRLQSLQTLNQIEATLRRLKKIRDEARGMAEQEQAPVRSAHDYISERKEYMDYAGALAAGLPIGSGEVEGGHRHVLQRRLKIPGAWWLEGNAEAML